MSVQICLRRQSVSADFRRSIFFLLDRLDVASKRWFDRFVLSMLYVIIKKTTLTEHLNPGFYSRNNGLHFSLFLSSKSDNCHGRFCFRSLNGLSQLFLWFRAVPAHNNNSSNWIIFISFGRARKNKKYVFFSFLVQMKFSLCYERLKFVNRP